MQKGKVILLSLIVLLSFTTIGFTKEIDNLFEKMTRMSRDIDTTLKSMDPGKSNEEKAAAIAKESSTFDDLKRTIGTIQTQDEIKKALEAIRKFSYTISSPAEKKAFQQTTYLLESRLKFLSQNEGEEFVNFLNEIEGLNRNAEKIQVSQERAPGSRVRELARSTRTDGNLPSGRLGAIVANGKTSFSVYAPDATEVNLVIFEKATDRSGRGYYMKKGQDGIWRTTIEGELYGKYYGFSVDGPKGPGYLFDPKRLLSDPYALANVDHNGKSIIVKTDFNWTDSKWKTPPVEELIIYEMHVKDYTAHPSSGVSAANKGKYLGLLEGKGTDKILGHLIDLGINAVELLPVHEFDNYFAGHPNHWGYMTSHFFAPECSYASGKNGEAVREFKQLVNGLHNAGIAVIMDVVFNHTAEGNEKGTPLNFKGLDNPGYYRLTPDKLYYWNGSGCGNEFRSENPMTRKYILDSLKYFINEYHIDGFRFDLATIIDKETMNAIITQLPPSTIIIAEPWAADWKRNQWGKTDFRNTKLAKWNDDFREKIRAFMRGQGDRNDVMTVIAGTCFWWTAKPTESVNYIECHDGATICDLFGGSPAHAKLGAAILLTSQGIPMIHQGQEFNKSKKGNHNSYDQDNEINWIDWTVKQKNRDIYEFYKGLIALRKKYPNFKHTTALTNQNVSWLLPPNHKGLGYHLKGKKDIIVLLNSDSNSWIKFDLPDQNDWIILCNGDKVDLSGSLGTARGDYHVPPVKAVILTNKL